MSRSNDPVRDKLLTVLTASGAGQVRHSGRSLLEHLLGTYDLLRQWDCDESICVAGGLHSIYSTEFFKYTLVDTIDRPKYQEAFGDVSERLAWIFCTMDRRKALEKELFINRLSAEPIEVTAFDRDALKLIEAANMIDQGQPLEKYPSVKFAMERQLSKA